jgi:DNA modification methylase
MTDAWRFQRVTGEERHGHATPKPVEMMKRVMLSSLPKGGICVEPFGGSGSTLMGAENTGRKCRAIEISPAYVAVAIQRWADATGKEPKRLT